jgi:aminoglycoside 6-adenylyltransferase
MRNCTTYAGLIDRITAWATNENDVKAVVIIGSRARANDPADEYSDLDLLLIVADTAKYFQSTDWIDAFGQYWLWFDERTPLGAMERRVLFDHALDVDFAIIGHDDLKQVLHSQSVSVLQRGYHILVDKMELHQILKRIPQAKPVVQPLEEHEYINIVKDFWYHTVWCTKKLLRGELWMAKSCLDGYMKRLMLRIIECHAHAKHGWDYDTWFDGRFFDTWADQQVKEGIRTTFAHYDSADIARALMASMDLFRATARDTADLMSFSYPQQEDLHTTSWVRLNIRRLDRANSTSSGRT